MDYYKVKIDDKYDIEIGVSCSSYDLKVSLYDSSRMLVDSTISGSVYALDQEPGLYYIVVEMDSDGADLETYTLDLTSSSAVASSAPVKTITIVIVIIVIIVAIIVVLIIRKATFSKNKDKIKAMLDFKIGFENPPDIWAPRTKVIGKWQLTNNYSEKVTVTTLTYNVSYSYELTEKDMAKFRESVATTLKTSNNSWRRANYANVKTGQVDPREFEEGWWEKVVYKGTTYYAKSDSIRIRIGAPVVEVEPHNTKSITYDTIDHPLAEYRFPSNCTDRRVFMTFVIKFETMVGKRPAEFHQFYTFILPDARADWTAPLPECGEEQQNPVFVGKK